jgi:hypothetical protein
MALMTAMAMPQPAVVVIGIGWESTIQRLPWIGHTPTGV